MSDKFRIVTVDGVKLQGLITSSEDILLAFKDPGTSKIYTCCAVGVDDYAPDLSFSMYGNFVIHEGFRYKSSLYKDDEYPNYTLKELGEGAVPEWAKRLIEAYVHSGCHISESGAGAKCYFDTSSKVGIWYLPEYTIESIESIMSDFSGKLRVEECKEGYKVTFKIGEGPGDILQVTQKPGQSIIGLIEYVRQCGYPPYNLLRIDGGLSDDDIRRAIVSQFLKSDLEWYNADSIYELKIIEFDAYGEHMETRYTECLLYSDVCNKETMAKIFLEHLYDYTSFDYQEGGMSKQEILDTIVENANVIMDYPEYL